MPRPSRAVDQALLASGRALFPQLGCSGMAVRAVAAHAGVSPGMFHYHFASKDGFLRALLQQLYEEMFGRLTGAVSQPGPPLQRLRQALLTLGRFVAGHGPVIGRILADAGRGEAVALEFVRRNVPRHVGLLLGLLAEAEAAGEIAPQPPLLRMSFLMGAIAAPLLVGQRIAELGIAPPALSRLLQPQVLSDDAIAMRIDLALRALAAPAPEGAPHAPT
jgi:AcrR family transcriptional regulator